MNANLLIRRDMVFAELADTCEEKRFTKMLTVDEMRGIVFTMPAAVVICKDCDEYDMAAGRCRISGAEMGHKDFCSKGKAVSV